MMKKTLQSDSSDRTKQIAYEIVTGLKSGTVLALYGDLGSGKTTFTQGIAEALHVDRQIQSPTFILMREYTLNGSKFHRLYHLDLYRLESYEQDELGLKDIMEDVNNLVVIEWADKITQLLPEKRIDIFFETDGEHARNITVDDKRYS